MLSIVTPWPATCDWSTGRLGSYRGNISQQAKTCRGCISQPTKTISLYLIKTLLGHYKNTPVGHY